MGCLTIIRRKLEDSHRAELRVRQVLASLEQQGFSEVRRFDATNEIILWSPPLADAKNPEQWGSFDSGAVGCVGSFFYKGLSGAAALKAYCADSDGMGPNRSSTTRGNFVLALSNGRRTWLVMDELGLVKIFQTSCGGVLSTSWLLCAQLQPQLSLRAQSAIEYILTGANHGTRTLVNEVDSLAPTGCVDINDLPGSRLDYVQRWFDEASLHTSFRDSLEKAESMMIELAAQTFDCHDHGVASALSGGFDSRLVLSMLGALSVDKKIYVYGRADDDDVKIATQIGQQLGFTVDQIDKSRIKIRNGEVSRRHIERNILDFDGLPPDGVIDNGVESHYRRLLAKSGRLQLNGGGGEVLRNFFYLSNRSRSAHEIVQTFYHGFNPKLFRQRRDYQAYVEMMADSVEQSVGRAGRLTRYEVEAVYPLLRCRYWMGSNNRIAARFGVFYTPLVDPKIIKFAMRMPLHWKTAGVFESALIARLSTSLAGQMLSYGFTPADGPSRLYRMKSCVESHRPPFLRAWSSRIKTTVKRSPEFRSTLPSGFNKETILSDLLDQSKLSTIAQRRRYDSVHAVVDLLQIAR